MPKIYNQKDQKKDVLMRKMGFPKNTRAVFFLDVHDEETKTFLSTASKPLNIGIVDSQNAEDMFGCDACITDGMGNIDLVQVVKSSLVPILPRDHALIGSFSEFDPMKFEGNAFIYESVNPYLIFEKMIRYLENIRYVGDKRTLLSNVAKTF